MSPAGKELTPCDGCGKTSTDVYVQRGPVWLCGGCDAALLDALARGVGLKDREGFAQVSNLVARACAAEERAVQARQSTETANKLYQDAANEIRLAFDALKDWDGTISQAAARSAEKIKHEHATADEFHKRWRDAEARNARSDVILRSFGAGAADGTEEMFAECGECGWSGGEGDVRRRGTHHETAYCPECNAEVARENMTAADELLRAHLQGEEAAEWADGLDADIQGHKIRRLLRASRRAARTIAKLAADKLDGFLGMCNQRDAAVMALSQIVRTTDMARIREMAEAGLRGQLVKWEGGRSE